MKARAAYTTVWTKLARLRSRRIDRSIHGETLPSEPRALVGATPSVYLSQGWRHRVKKTERESSVLYERQRVYSPRHNV